MNAFIEHHQPAIRFDYSCFDRILLNGVIQVLPNPPASSLPHGETPGGAG